MNHVVARQKVLASILAIGSAVAFLWTLTVVLLGVGISAQPPNPRAINGEPCCPVLDTWNEVITWSAATLALTLFCAGLLCLCIGCARFLFTSRPPSKSLLKVPPIMTAAVAILMLVLTAVR